MNILITSYYYKPRLGGIENSIFHLSRIFKDSGHDVRILVSDAGDSKAGRLSEKEEVDNVIVYRFRRFIPANLLFNLTGFRNDSLRIKERVKKITDFTPDLVIARHYRVIPALRECYPDTNLIYVIPGIPKYQEWIGKDYYLKWDLKKRVLRYFINSWLLPVKQRFFKQSLTDASVNVAFSENVIQQIRSAFPGLDVSVRKINPGVDTTRFRPANPGKDFTFICVGRLVGQKGIDTAILAFAKMKESDSRLVIVGDGPLKKQYLQLSQENDVADRIQFAGSTPNPETYLEQSHVFLMTSRHEPFGQTILEAMSCGLPVIGYRSGDGLMTATSEIVEDEKNGILCSFGVEELSMAMARIKNMDAGQYQKIRDNNIAKINRLYIWENLARDLLKLNKDE